MSTMDKDDLAGPRRGRARARKGGSRCPICEAPALRRFRPFCSKRCQDMDLGRWLLGAYRIPAEEAPGEGDLGAAEGDDDLPFGGRA